MFTTKPPIENPISSPSFSPTILHVSSPPSSLIKWPDDGYDYSSCVGNTDRSIIGDGKCDYSEYDKETCNWEGGDCCTCCVYPDDGFDYGSCGFEFPCFVGDGVCDGSQFPGTYGAECNFDGKDCPLDPSNYESSKGDWFESFKGEICDPSTCGGTPVSVNDTVSVTESPTITPSMEPSSGGTVSVTESPMITPSMEPSTSSDFDLTQAEESSCNMGVEYGHFENGEIDLFRWRQYSGGNILLYSNPDGNDDDKYALRVSDRETIHDGPKHRLNVDCFVADRIVHIRALMKLIQGDAPFKCDPHSTCPILTLEFEMQAGSFYQYYQNEAIRSWTDDGSYNEFQSYFTVTEAMTLAKRVFFYFERPPAGVDMIIDDVEVKEYESVPEGNLHLEGDDSVDYDDCRVIVKNGDAELGDTSGWTARLGGYLSVRPEGADNTGHSFEHNGRTSFIMGPKHVLKTKCFIEGARYAFDAKMKLLDEEGNPFVCDKTHHWIDESSCPILSFQLESPSGKSWRYYGNQAPGPWKGEIWNPFNTFFTITQDIVDATDAYFYIERPRAGISMIIDEVVISRDCTTLIPNHDAEQGTLSGWHVWRDGAGKVDLYPEGADESLNSFAHAGRDHVGIGPAHKLDIGCLVEGRQYEFLADFKLLDEMNGGTPVACKRNVPWGDPDYCPLLSIMLMDDNGSAAAPVNLQNADPSTWFASEFNRYHTTFTVTAEMVAAYEVYIMFKGPRPGVTMLFDNVDIKLYEPPEIKCEEMVTHGDFEDNNFDGWQGWHVRHSGSLQIFDEGAEDGSKSLLIVDRELPGAGFKHATNNTCLVEGKRYEFRAEMKLVTEDGSPCNCSKAIGYNHPESCPLFGFELKKSGVTSTKLYGNEDPSIFSSYEWNSYRAIFTVPHEISTSDSSFFMVMGPRPGVGIMVDKVSLEEYHLVHSNCNQLVVNGNAEDDNLEGWLVNGGGYISIEDGGASDTDHSFVQTHRTRNFHGPKQYLPLECLKKEDDTFTFHALLKLLDENGKPYACDKTAAWNTALTCPLLSIQLSHPVNGVKRIHFGNSYGRDWDASDWNEYRATVTVTKEMMEASDIFFYIQGVRPGASVMFDEVSMLADTPPVS